MPLVLPPAAAVDWHLVLRLSLYTDSSSLHCYSYQLSKRRKEQSRQCFPQVRLDRPRNEWEALQAMAYGVDLLTARTYP